MGSFWSNVRGQMARFLRGNQSTNHFGDLDLIVVFDFIVQ
jgi:hypothetical protein